MIKLKDILNEILTEKLCKKGQAYVKRRKAKPYYEKHSAYLMGRASKVCKGLMEEDDLNEGQYDDKGEGAGYDLVKQNPFNIQKLIDKGIIFVIIPGDGKGDVTKPNWEGDFSILTLYNMDKAESWMKKAIKNPLPKAIPYAQKNQDKLIYNGKYNQILWGIEKKGLKPEDFYLNTNESLRDWFKKEDWVRIDTQGNITGPCGTMKKGKATTRCLPRKKAQSLTKAERAATSRKKVAGSKKGKQFVKNTKAATVRLNK